MTKTNTPDALQFFDAISTNDIVSVRKLVGENPKLLDAFDYRCFGATPLTRVSFDDGMEMIDALIELGADPNRCSDWEMGPWSPLHSALSNHNLTLAEHLLKCGAQLDACAAAGIGLVDELERLLDEDPTAVEQLGGDGRRPLHFAGSADVAKLLLDRGADIESRCIDHYSTPVQYLALSRPEVARFLFSQGAVPDIFSAAMAGAVDTVEQLIDQNPAILQERIGRERFPPGPEQEVNNILNFTVGTGCGPIHAAACGNQPASIVSLVRAGQTTELRGGYDQQTALHAAAWNNHVEASRALIECDADIDALSGDIHNNSPAGWAIVGGSADVFELLLDSGARVYPWFVEDAKAALDGRFKQYKCVAQQNYDRIWRRLNQAIDG